MSEKQETIGEVLKKARLRKKMKAETVAELCNVSRSRVYQWEASGYVFPKNLQRLSHTLGISMRRLNSVNGERDLTAA